MRGLSSPKTILVRAPNWIGDQILAYPFFHHLRESFPQAKISVACASWVQSIQFKNCVDQVFVLPQPREKTFLGRWEALNLGAQVIQEQGPWDLGFSLPNSFSSAWFLWRSRVRVRVGYATEGRSLLLTHAFKPSSEASMHRSQAYLSLLAAAVPQAHWGPAEKFWGVPPVNELDPGVPGVLSEFDASRAWGESDILEPPVGPYWVLAPGSQAASRRWPGDSFAALAQLIASECNPLGGANFPGLVVGGASEMDMALEWAQDKKLNLQDWTARGTPASYWKVFRNAQFAVCNDSGLAHLSALCGTKTHIVWGAGSPGVTEPIGPGQVQISMNPVACWPCQKNQCLLPASRNLECLRGIYADVVWNEIRTGFRIPKGERASFSLSVPAHLTGNPC
ncbi:MAG: glycosyltransferase family 9 protein [Bdellovibrionia bacterium]